MTATGFVGGKCAVTFTTPFSGTPDVYLTIFGFRDQFAQTLHLDSTDGDAVTPSEVHVYIAASGQFCAGCSQNFEILAIGPP